MQKRSTLQISGSHPAVWLLALLVARSGQQVRVYRMDTQPTDILRIAEAPFDWFGEELLHWPVDWYHCRFSGIAWYEAGPELFPWQMIEIATATCLKAMSCDAQNWGAEVVFSDINPAWPWLDLCTALTPTQGFWLWESLEPLSPPGILEIIPQEKILAWSYSCKNGVLALAGCANQMPEQPQWLEVPVSLPKFQREPYRWQRIRRTGIDQITMRLPEGALTPAAAIQQALIFMWSRYAGEQLARYGICTPQVWERIDSYWNKLIMGSKNHLRKYKFLQ